MRRLQQSTSAGDRDKLESQFGTRFSVLGELPYFDTIRMCTIDPMHNLFMGTAKLMIRIWKELKFIDRNAQEKMQEKANQFVVPSSIGKLPKKNVTGFDGFTADFHCIVYMAVFLLNMLPVFGNWFLHANTFASK